MEVSNQAELIKALNDVSVDNIVLQNSKWPTWNFTEQQMPVNSSYIVGRDVVLEGAPGSLVYVDVSCLGDATRPLFSIQIWSE